MGGGQLRMPVHKLGNWLMSRPLEVCKSLTFAENKQVSRKMTGYCALQQFDAYYLLIY